MTKSGNFKPFTQLLSSWDQNAQEVLTVLQQLTRQWPVICETELAMHSRPLWLRNHQLSIEADSALWANRIHHSRVVLLGRIREQGFSKISSIEARVRPSTLTRQTISDKEQVSTDVINNMRKLATSIEDPELRAALLRLANTTANKKA